MGKMKSVLLLSLLHMVSCQNEGTVMLKLSCSVSFNNVAQCNVWVFKVALGNNERHSLSTSEFHIANLKFENPTSTLPQVNLKFENPTRQNNGKAGLNYGSSPILSM